MQEIQLFAFRQPLVREVVSPAHGVRETVLADGSAMYCDQSGRIVQAHYANGMKVRLNNDCKMVESLNGCFFFAGRSGNWFPLD